MKRPSYSEQFQKSIAMNLLKNQSARNQSARNIACAKEYISKSAQFEKLFAEGLTDIEYSNALQNNPY